MYTSCTLLIACSLAFIATTGVSAAAHKLHTGWTTFFPEIDHRSPNPYEWLNDPTPLQQTETQLEITDFDWGPQRVDVVKAGEVIIRNSGETQLTLTAVELADPDNPGFRIVRTTPDITDGPMTLAPQSADRLVVEIEFTPHSEGAHSNFVVAHFDDGDDAGTVSGALAGVGILPKIVAIGHRFATTTVQTVSPEQGWITIVNPSATADLYVQEVAFEPQIGNLSATGAFAWRGDAILEDFNVPRNGGSITIPVNFTAVATANSADVRIISDAERGPDNDPRDTTVVQVSGDGVVDLSRVLVVGDWSLERQSICETGIGILELINRGVEEVTIIDIRFEGADAFAFDVETQQLPFSVPSGATPTALPIAFSPDEARAFACTARLFTADGEIAIPLSGAGFTASASLRLDVPSTQTYHGQIVDIPIYLDAAQTDDLEKISVSEFNLTLQYDFEALGYELGSFKPGAAANGWTFTAREYAALQTLEISGMGAAPLREGLVCTIQCTPFLSNARTVDIQTNTISTDREECLVITSSTATMRIAEVCIQDGRRITAPFVRYELLPTIPNPAVHVVTIEYSIAYSARTSLVLCNTMGKVERSIIDELQRPGRYQARIDVSDLPSGMYYYRLSSGPFNKTHTMIIAK